MKKFILLAAVAATMSLCSCNTISHTASTETVDTQILNRSTADLKVSPNVVSYTFTPARKYRRAGERSVKNAAIAKALEANGGGDFLVAAQYEVRSKQFLFWKWIKEVTVTGHPATYVNVHPTTQAEADVVVTLKSRR